MLIFLYFTGGKRRHWKDLSWVTNKSAWKRCPRPFPRVCRRAMKLTTSAHLSHVAQSRWASMTLEAREARIARMHAGRDAHFKALAQKSEGEDSMTLGKWRKLKGKALHEAVFKARNIARAIARTVAAYPVTDGLETITIEEVADLFGAGRCEVTGSSVSGWGKAGPTWWQPVPLCLDPQLGLASGNVAACSVRGHQLMSGALPLVHERLGLERFLARHPEAVVSSSRILPDLKAACPLDKLPLAIRSDLDLMEQREREVADAEISSLFPRRP